MYVCTRTKLTAGSLEGSGAIEWWWDDKSEDKPVFWYLTPEKVSYEGVDVRYWHNTSQWWLLDTGGCMASPS